MDPRGPTISVDAPLHADPAVVEPQPLERGVSVGRYVLIDVLGAGGMGVVHRAYDPELHRRVAVKVLAAPQHADTLGVARMLREAQAQAQLSHPNVVAIYDVGSLADHVYIAMELVEGRTLGAWLRAQERSWREVVEVFVQAGRGLAAAHAENLVHRDFKPDNAMVDEEGRVRVMDFGLARTIGVGPDSAANADPNGLEESGPTQPESVVLRSDLTKDGAVMGTPGYMAPEQFNGLPTDARTDQFSFCVALWEGLHGRRPFQAGTIWELGRAVCEGEIADPDPSEVPARIDEVLRRGLSPDPDDRWPSMRELLDALGAVVRPPTSRRWLLPAVPGTVCALGLAIWIARADDRCTGSAAELASVWSPERADAIGRSLAELDVRSAPAVWETQRGRLDAYADEWIAAHHDACVATAVRREQSEAVLDRRMACLRKARFELDATLGELERPDRELVDRAYTLVGAIAPVSRCADVDALADDAAPPPPELADAAKEVEQEVARARASLRAGRFAEALPIAEAAVDKATDLGHEPTMVPAIVVHAEAQMQQANNEAALESARQAEKLAFVHGQWRQALNATRLELWLVGDRMARPKEVTVAMDLALALLARVDDPDLAGALHGTFGSIAIRAGDFPEAERELTRAMELRREAPEVNELAIATLLHNLARAEEAEAHLEDSLAHLHEAREIEERILGPDNAMVATTLNTTGTTLAAMGRMAEAEQAYREALKRRGLDLRPGHPHIAITLMNLATTIEDQGRPEEAEGMLKEALELMEHDPGPHALATTSARTNYAQVRWELGDLEEAESQLRQALVDRKAALPEGHPDIGRAEAAMGLILVAREKYDEAQVHERAAQEILDATHGPGHEMAVKSRIGMADALLASGRMDEAEAELRKALAAGSEHLGEDHEAVMLVRGGLGRLLLEHGEPGDVDEARALLEASYRVSASSPRPIRHARDAWGLARALWPDPSQRARALELAEEARSIARDVGGDEHLALADEIEAWIEARSGPRD